MSMTLGQLLAQQSGLGPNTIPGINAPRQPWQTPGINPAANPPSRFPLLDAGRTGLNDPAMVKAFMAPEVPEGLPPSQKPVETSESPPQPARAISDLAPNTPQNFDYEAAADQILGKPKKMGDLQKIALIIGAGLMGATGNQQGVNQLANTVMRRREEQDQRRYETVRDLIQRRWQDHRAQYSADLDAGQPFSSGRDRVRWNPQSGKSEVIYDGSEDFETYAQTIGLEPGTAEYFKAVEDYVLRGHGPTAFGRSKEIDDYRTANDIRAEGVRHGNRVRLRGTPTYRDRHGTPPKRSTGPTATGPNGEKIRWNGKEWVPAN